MSLYHPSIHDTMVRAPSYWEETAGSSRGDWPALEGGQTCGVAIIGGGFTGLSAALHLARDHGIDARVLEAGSIAWGRPADGERMRAWMTRRLGEVFPGWCGVPITHFWRGLVCVTRRLAPSVGRLDDDPSVWYGFGYHANGVNTAPWTGMRLARAVAGEVEAADVAPTVMRGLPARFPFPALRLWALRGAYLYYRFQDRR